MPDPQYFTGMPVSTGIYNALMYLAPRYKARWGYELKVRDGLRTMASQWKAWYARQAYLNGAGPFAPVAAYPDETAPHIAGYGVDLYDTDPNPSLTVIGSPQNNWLHEEGKAVGLTNVGRTFAEGWHFEIPRGTEWAGTPASGGAIPLPTPEENLPEEDDEMKILKIMAPKGSHFVALDRGTLRHFIQSDPIRFVTNIERSRDDIQEVPWDNLNALLRTNAVDLNAYRYDEVKNLFEVLDPDTGKYGVGQVWTIEGKYAARESGTEPSPSPETPTDPTSPTSPVVKPVDMPTVYEPLVTPPAGWPKYGFKMAHIYRPNAEIQNFLSKLGFYTGKIDGQYGPMMSQAVAMFQWSRWLLPDGVWGTASDGTAFPPAGMIKPGIDFSFTEKWDAKTIAARGQKFVMRYAWQERYADGRRSKGMSRAEYDSYREAGLDVGIFYETDSTDPILGRDVGRRHAIAAEEYLKRVGLQGSVIFFNFDRDMAISEIPRMLEGCQGAAEIVGLERMGLYGEFDAVKAAFDEKVITYADQTYGWSRGLWDPRAQVRQWCNAQWGDTVDFQYAMAADWGQVK